MKKQKKINRFVHALVPFKNATFPKESRTFAIHEVSCNFYLVLSFIFICFAPQYFLNGPKEKKHTKPQVTNV